MDDEEHTMKNVHARRERCLYLLSGRSDNRREKKREPRRFYVVSFPTGKRIALCLSSEDTAVPADFARKGSKFPSDKTVFCRLCRNASQIAGACESLIRRAILLRSSFISSKNSGTRYRASNWEKSLAYSSPRSSTGCLHMLKIE